MGSLPFLPHTT